MEVVRRGVKRLEWRFVMDKWQGGNNILVKLDGVKSAMECELWTCRWRLCGCTRLVCQVPRRYHDHIILGRKGCERVQIYIIGTRKSNSGLGTR
jgi:hypothetical protein